MADTRKIQAYQSVMAQAMTMFERGIIDRADLVIVEKKMAAKYGLKIGSIYREIDLINIASRVNMV